MRNKLILCLLLCLSSPFTYGQRDSSLFGLIGFARFEFGWPRNKISSSFSCGISFAFHRETKIAKNLFIDLAYQPAITLYQRGFGTSTIEHLPEDDQHRIDDKVIKQSSSSQIDLVNSISFTLGGAKKPDQIQLENRTFHYFHRSALTQSYNSSISLGTNFISNFNGRHQQIGFCRASIWKANLAYYNDGTPYQKFFLGDGRDRWWTGGGYFQYGNDRQNPLQSRKEYSFALGFDRFTGYSYGMFELGNLLRQSFVLHKDVRQYFLDSGRNYAIFNDLSNNYSLSFSANNIPKLDIQNLIHNNGSMSKHYSLLKESYTLGLLGLYSNKFKP